MTPFGRPRDVMLAYASLYAGLFAVVAINVLEGDWIVSWDLAGPVVMVAISPLAYATSRWRGRRPKRLTCQGTV
jgi:hypothetical protein